VLDTSPSGALSGGLTSGYYDGEGQDPLGTGRKCHHGGLWDWSTPSVLEFRAGISKDSLACNWSPHNDLHLKAVDVAQLATRKFFEDLVLHKGQLRLLFGIGPPLPLPSTRLEVWEVSSRA
jgi:hypothetical protein